MSRSIAVYIPPRAHLSGVALPTDLAQMANGFALARVGAERRPGTREAGAPVRCRWLSLDGQPVTLAHGLPCPVDGGLSDEPVHDAIFIADFEAGDAQRPAGWEAPPIEPALAAWLRRQHQHGALIAASGTAVVLLAASGLLDRRRATAPWWLQKRFRRLYPAVRLTPSQAITEHDGLYCADSLSSLLPMGLRLLRRITSANTADWLGRNTLIGHAATEPRQAPADMPDDPLIASALFHLQQHYATPGGITSLADRLAVSPRTLTRRFQKALGCTPVVYIQRLRIESAKHMLRRTTLQVDHIAQQVGYSDSAYFKKLFRRHTGHSPSSWRRGAPSST